MTRLFALARQAPPVAADVIIPAMPPGFATRVAARWVGGEGGVNLADVWERLCWRGAAVAAVICLAVFCYSTQVPEPTAFNLMLESPASDFQQPPAR